MEYNLKMSDISNTILNLMPVTILGAGFSVALGYTWCSIMATIDPKVWGIKDRKSAIPYFLKSAFNVDILDYLRMNDQQFAEKYPQISKYLVKPCENT